MGTSLGKAYYNAVSTMHASYVLAVGWTVFPGTVVELKVDVNTGNFHLEIHRPNDSPKEEITPFEVTARIYGKPRSVFVDDDFGQHHVQVHDLKLCEGGSNEPGKWVESREMQ